jgi:hypothetical protein
MNNCNKIGVDLAKHVIQVCVVSPRKQALLNKALTRKKFANSFNIEEISILELRLRETGGPKIRNE